MSYPLYLVQSQGMPRNHHAIFVRFGNGSEPGRLFNVTGHIMSGMSYETIEPSQPEDSPTFLEMSSLGWVSTSDLHRVDDVCRANPPPGKQFDGLRRIDPNTPLRRCQEWAVETVQQLKGQGILREDDGQVKMHQVTGSRP